MLITVEPRDGSELERLVTALLNATGVVHRLIGATDHPPDADGDAVIGRVAERIRHMVTMHAEHFSDDELALVTGLLAATTLLIAAELGLSESFTD